MNIIDELKSIPLGSLLLGVFDSYSKLHLARMILIINRDLKYNTYNSYIMYVILLYLSKLYSIASSECKEPHIAGFHQSATQISQ